MGPKSNLQMVREEKLEQARAEKRKREESAEESSVETTRRRAPTQQHHAAFQMAGTSTAAGSQKIAVVTRDLLEDIPYLLPRNTQASLMAYKPLEGKT
jgi:hypothetical protein